MFQVKFNQIESLEKEIRVEKGNTDEKRMDLSEKLRDLDVLNRMLEQIRRLNESYETKVIIEQLAEGTLKLFESNYACLYIRREQYFEKFSEAGRNDRHEVPETISFEEGMKPQMDNKMMRIPIMYEEKVWGIIAVYDKKSILGQGKQKVLFPFEELDLDVLVLYLQQAMIKLSHTNLIAEMKSMALIDPLTGLDNRRAFNDNDRFGHEVGDEVLRVVGETIKDSVRKVDIVARWGGEEFAVLLPNASGNAEIIGERIRRNIKSIEFQIPITVSVGVAFYGAHGTEEKELLGNADKATYYAKQHGRDQVVIYSEEIG
jgi:GGDEF domain-containing protein